MIFDTTYTEREIVAPARLGTFDLAGRGKAGE